MTIGKQLRDLRLQKNYSQQDVAKKLVITRQSISKWELDKAMPDLTMLSKLALLYDFSIDELLQLKEEKIMSLPTITPRQMAETTGKCVSKETSEAQIAFLEKEFFQPITQKLTAEKILWQVVVPTKTVGMATNLTSETPVTQEKTKRYFNLFPGDNSIYLFLTTEGFYPTTAVEWLEKASVRKIPLAEIDWLVVGAYYSPNLANSGHGLFYGTHAGNYDSFCLSPQGAAELAGVLPYLDAPGRHFRQLTKTPIAEVLTLWRKKKSLPWE